MENNLHDISLELRKTVVEMLYRIGEEYKGHPGPSLSIIDILTCLYFKVMNIKPEDPNWDERDRFILSKGHSCPALYSVLALKGYFNKEALYTFRHIDSMLQGHPDMRKTPGIDMTAGSLGNGLAAGVGMALSAKMDNKKYKVYVVLGDGELQEGLVWEALMYAGSLGINNLVAIIDRNRFQSCGSVECIVNIEPLYKKLSSFNWNVLECDGHNIEELIKVLTFKSIDKPLTVIANTIKGKGVSFMENDNSWHQKAVVKKDYDTAVKDLNKQYQEELN